MKKTFVLMMAVLVLLAVVGCGGKIVQENASAPAVSNNVPAGPGPSSPDLKATADKVLKLTEAGEWSELYDYFYVDIQKDISRDELVSLKKEQAAHMKITYKNYKVGEPKTLAKWADKGRAYTNVTEVPYTVEVVTPKGEMKVTNSIHLIQTPEKNWRYLWVDNR